MFAIVLLVRAEPSPAPDAIVREASAPLRLQPDAELAAAARCLAEAHVEGKALDPPWLRHCAWRAGVYDNLLLPVVTAHRGARGLVENLAPFFALEVRGRALTHYGAAVVVHEGWVHIAVLMTLRRAELRVDEVPKQPGEVLSFHGSLGPTHTGARAFLSTPSGSVQPLQVQVRGGDRRVFHGSVHVPDELGRYQLEIVADTENGPIVVANRALFVGDDPASAPAPHEQAAYGASDGERLWALMNTARERLGLAPFVLDPDLSRVAHAHAAHMAERHYFGHDTRASGSRSEATVIMRLKAARIHFSEAAENIAESASIEDAHESLMSSPGHRQSILSPRFRKVGVGVAEGRLASGDRSVYVVVDFVAP